MDEECDDDLKIWRLQRRKELEEEYNRHQLCNKLKGTYIELQSERDTQNFRGFPLGLCLLHDRINKEDALHENLQTIAQKHPQIMIAHLHQSKIKYIEEMQKEEKPCLLKFCDGKIATQASASEILSMFQRASLQDIFSKGLIHEIERFLDITIQVPDDIQPSKETNDHPDWHGHTGS